MRSQGHWPHLANAAPHKAALSLQKTKDAGSLYGPRFPIPLIWHPATFLAFARLKKELEERSFRSENEMIIAVQTILEAIMIGVLSEVFDQWIARLHRCIARRESMSKSISVG
jgi:hypothetical protein